MSSLQFMHLCPDRGGSPPIEHEGDRAEVNETLAKVGLKFEGKVKVRHFARVLYEEVGLGSLKKSFVKSLEGLRVASHYGCHDPNHRRFTATLIRSKTLTHWTKSLH